MIKEGCCGQPLEKPGMSNYTLAALGEENNLPDFRSFPSFMRVRVRKPKGEYL